MVSLKITDVNTHPVPDPDMEAQPRTCFLVPPITIPFPADKQLIVQGTGFTKPLCCSLVRLGTAPAQEEVETIFHVTRFVNKPADKNGTWRVIFPVASSAVYLFTCHSFQKGLPRRDNAYLEIKVNPRPGKHGGGTRLIFTDGTPTFAANSISATGSVQYADNNVYCSLTQVDCTTGAQIGKGKTLPAEWMDQPNDTLWSNSFAPGAFGLVNFRGKCFLYEAHAAGEGTISASGSVP
jgi:hypothetical protein